MELITQLGGFLGVALGFILLVFGWAWYRGRTTDGSETGGEPDPDPDPWKES